MQVTEDDVELLRRVRRESGEIMTWLYRGPRPSDDAEYLARRQVDAMAVVLEGIHKVAMTLASRGEGALVLSATVSFSDRGRFAGRRPEEVLAFLAEDAEALAALVKERARTALGVATA